MDKSRPKPTKDSSWNDENEKITNPDRRQDEDQDTNVESPQGGQRASTPDRGPSGSRPSNGRDLSEDELQQTDTSRRQRQSSEE